MCSKHELLVVEIDLEVYTAAHVVMVEQVKARGTGPEQLGGRLRKELGRKEATLCGKV